MKINREDPFAMMGMFPPVFRPANRWLYYLVRWSSFAVVLPLLWRYQLIGKENLARAQDLRESGHKLVMDFDHWGWADIPVPIALFWWHGFRKMTTDIFFLIGVRQAEKLSVQGANRAYLVPPPILPPKMSQAQMSQVGAYTRKVLGIIAKQLSQGQMAWVSSQGTRARVDPSRPKDPPEMLPAAAGAALIWKQADYVVAISLENTHAISPVGSWFPRFWQPLRVIVGVPTAVRGRFPTADDMGLARSCLHIRFGDPRYAGYYRERAEAIVAAARQGEEEKELATV